MTKRLRKVNRVPVHLRAKLLGIFGAISVVIASPVCAQEETTSLVPEVVDFSKLLPLLPDAPADWKADKPEGSTDEVSGSKITNVHRDYQKGDASGAPTTAISILDSAANPEYVSATTAAWTASANTPEGYTKSLTIDEMPGYETFENDGKHGTLWLMVAKRFVLQIETKGQDSKALQEWLKRIDLKKLAAVK